MRNALCAFLLLTALACGDDDDSRMMNGPRNVVGPGPAASNGYGAALVSVTPAGGAIGVPTSISITFRFSAPMAAASEQYVDLHLAGIDGPTIPTSCGFSSDRTTLTCTPNAPLAPRTTYVVHIGGGMMTQAGQPIDLDAYGHGNGGRWLMGGAMGPMHGGHGWGMVGPGWRGPNGSYGMEFSFTTA